MTKKSLIALFIIILCNSGFSQVNHKIPSDKPKLIVGIHLSHFRNDYIPAYWDNLSDGGIKKISTQGTVCKNTQINYYNPDAGTGIATIVSGSLPSEHGMVSEYWFSALKEELIYCIGDKTVKTIGGAYENGRYSPKNLLGTTYTDELKLSTQFKSKVYSVSMSPVPAVISAGHAGNMAFWFDEEKGSFISSSYYADTLPWWADTFNVKKIPDTYLEGEWKMSLPPNSYSFHSQDNSPYETGIRKQNEFPYQLEKLSKKIDRQNPYKALNYTPYGNTLVKDFAIQIIVNENLGQDEFTDVISLNITSTELIASHFGPLSIEMEDLILKLDKEIEHLLTFLDDYIGIENTLVYLSAEQGIGYPAEYLTDNKIPAGEFSAVSAKMLLLSYLNNLYGKGNWVVLFESGQVQLNTNLIENAELDYKEVQKTVSDFLIQFHGIKYTETAYTLQNTYFNSGVSAKIQNGYNKKRSGDVFYVLRDGWVEKTDRKTISKPNHHTVPLIFYGWKIKRKTIYTPVTLDDIAPTINSLLEINLPQSATGKPIEEILRK